MSIFSVFGSVSSKKKTTDVPPSQAEAVPTPLPKVDPKSIQEKMEKTLDLTFIMDCTGSMGSYIDAAKSNITAIVKRLSEQENADVRFGLVAYRDHPPQDATFITKTFPFTTTLSAIQQHLGTLDAAGGGDGPEAVAAALKSALDMNWREEATKICILIADAPPHGLGEDGDGFPNGSPDGVDPLQVLDQMGAKGICVYAVGCEPALGSYKYAREFMIACAERTEGQAVSLASAASLAEVIMGGAIEEMDLEKLMAEVEQDVVKLQAAEPTISEEVIQRHVYENMKSRGQKTRQLHTKKLQSNYCDHYVSKAKSLSEARATLSTAAPLTGLPPTGVAMSVSVSEGIRKKTLRTKTPMAPPMPASSRRSELSSAAICEEDNVKLAEAEISFEQVSRMYNRGKKKGMF